MTAAGRHTPSPAYDQALALVEQGITRLGLCEYPAALDALERAWAILEPLDRPGTQGVCLFYLAVARGDVADAPVDPDVLRRALALLEAGGERLSAGDCCSALARVTADSAAKDEYLARAIEHYRSSGSLLRLPHALNSRGRLALERGHARAAGPWIDEALALVGRVDVGWNARRLEAEILETKGDVLVATRRRADALETYQAAEALYRQLERLRELSALEAKMSELSGSVGRWVGRSLIYGFGDLPERQLRRSPDGTLEAAWWRSCTSEDYYDESASYEIVVWNSTTGDVHDTFTRTWSLAKNTGEESGRPVRDVAFRPNGDLVAVFDDGSEEVLLPASPPVP
jgi:hypothetical protein